MISKEQEQEILTRLDNLILKIRGIQIKPKQISEKGTIMYLALAKHMLDVPEQPNNYIEAIVKPYKGRLWVQWVNGSSAILKWGDLKLL